MSKIRLFLLMLIFCFILLFLFAGDIAAMVSSRSVYYSIGSNGMESDSFRLERGDLIIISIDVDNRPVMLRIIHTMPAVYIGGEFPVITARERTVWGPKNITSSTTITLKADRSGIYIFIFENPTEGMANINVTYDVKRISIPEQRIKAFSTYALVVALFTYILFYLEERK